jgi:hypothetical protein
MATVLPPGTALDRAARERLAALVELLKAAERELAETLRLTPRGRYTERYFRARLAETREILDRLVTFEGDVASGAWVEWAREAFPVTYGSGIGFARADLAAQGVAALTGDMRIHTAAVEALLTRYVTDVVEIAVELNVAAVRASRVLMAQAGLTDQIATGILSGEARRTTSARIARAIRRATAEALPADVEFDPASITHVEINGRRWRLDAYAEMHARTATAEAVTQGTINTTVANGVLHVQVTAHAHEPCICTPFEGRIYRLFEDRGDMRFPHVSIMPNGGTPLHPNCAHRTAPAVVEYLEERGDVAGRMRVPDGIEGMDERELAKWVRDNRDRLGTYSRRRDGILPETFRVRQEVAA